MKKTFVTLLSVLCALAAQAQLCNLHEGTALVYVVSDRETNEVRLDTAFVSDIASNGGQTIVEQSFCNRKAKAKDSIFDGQDVIKFAHKADGTTERIVIDEEWGTETMKTLRKELAAQGGILPDETEFEKELDALAEREKGMIAIPLKRDAAKGETFPSAKYSLKAGFMKVGMEISKGKYEGTEKVVVPAGTFDCLKLSYRQKKSILYLPKTQFLTQWYAEGVGLVKEEVTDKKGKRLKCSRTLLAVIPSESR